ncbi:MAG: carboxypeptidase M32 [Lachnospiraceae bacterium]|nr:carboxypeptidase M32 [Lachnospiraceae bacterium]
MSETLDRFLEYRNKMRQYGLAVSMLYWDLQTATPKKGVECKTEAIGFFSTESFKLSTGEAYGKLLEALSRPEEFDLLTRGIQVTVTREKEEYTRYKRIPQDFYTELVTLTAKASRVWEEAKKNNDFAMFEPVLDQMIQMTKQSAKYQEPDMDPYEFMLSRYEKGMDTKQIEKLFEELKSGLVPLLAKIKAAAKPDLSALKGEYDLNAQRQWQEFLLKYIGFDYEGGGVAEAEHPFTTSLGTGDVRVTNHFYTDDPINAMFSAIHEGGHAIFEQNIDPAFWNTAVANIDLMGLHESQSRFFENMLGRNKNFWIPIYEKLGEYMPQFKEVPLDLFYRVINDVRPSLIRTAADEVTYGLHVILRFEMEKAIFGEGVPTSRLPELWNEKMEELLGIRPETDREGILQDVHWSNGYFGYFPSYLLGSIYDGMILAQLEKEMGSVDQILKEGRVKEITRWLNERIHKNGSLYTSGEVIGNLCGEGEISAKPLMEYFNKKYSELYGF